MTNEALQERIKGIAPDTQITENKQFLITTVSSKDLHIVAKSLKESHDLLFDYLFSLTGVDNNPSLGVVYHLQSTTLKHSIVLKTATEDRQNPLLDSVCDLWQAAELQEREVYDLLGIRFNNHPDMRRLFLDDEWKGYPLRKDYVDTVNIIDLIK